MDQVHGARVIRVPDAGDDPGRGGRASGAVTAVFSGTGDVLVSDAPGCSLSVLTADCAPVALGSGEGVFAAVHAGWRGLREGVVEEAVAAMRALGATRVVGALGPCVHPGCYEFAPGDLDDLAAYFGDRVRGRTSAGRPALDIPAAVSVALAAAGADEVPGVDACTACAGRYFSHRARHDGGRQALVVWSTPA